MLGQFFDVPINARASAFLFPGYLPILLALAAVLSRRTRAQRREVVLYGAITAIAIVLSSGPPISVWPYVYWLPGSNFIRIQSRFFLLAMLGIAVLAAIGFERLATLLRPGARRGLAVAVSMPLVAEFAAIPLQVTPYTVEFNAVDRWLASQPKPFAVAEVPVGATTRSHSNYTPTAACCRLCMKSSTTSCAAFQTRQA